MREFVASNEFNVALQLVQKIAQCQDIQGLSKLLGECSSLIGGEQCLAILIPSVAEISVSRKFLVNHSFDESWLGLYQQRNFEKVDPILQSHVKSPRLQAWGSTYAQSQGQNDFRGIAGEFGLVHGVSHGFWDPCLATTSLISFGTKAHCFDANNYWVVDLVVGPIHQALLRLSPKCSHSSVPALSEREREILIWSSAGKTSWEIGLILCISERTVKFHFSNAFKKLKVTNRIQALARCVELDIINCF